MSAHVRGSVYKEHITSVPCNLHRLPLNAPRNELIFVWTFRNFKYIESWLLHGLPQSHCHTAVINWGSRAQFFEMRCCYGGSSTVMKGEVKCRVHICWPSGLAKRSVSSPGFCVGRMPGWLRPVWGGEAVLSCRGGWKFFKHVSQIQPEIVQYPFLLWSIGRVHFYICQSRLWPLVCFWYLYQDIYLITLHS